MTNQCSIQNNSKTVTLPVDILSWNASQESSPSIRDIPTGTNQFLDGGTYVLAVRQGKMTCRLTTAERDILNSIFDESKLVYIYLRPLTGITGWRLIGWQSKKDFDYEYRKDASGNIKCWFTSLEFDISEDKYYTDLDNLVEG